MVYQRIYVFVLIIDSLITLRMSYKIDVYDRKMYEIESDDMDYDEQDENEMIKPKDLVGFESFADEESRYKPLHSHVESYNRRETENKMKFRNMYPYIKSWEKQNNEPKEEAFVAGFKEDLDKVRVRSSFKIADHKKSNRNSNSKRNIFHAVDKSQSSLKSMKSISSRMKGPHRKSSKRDAETIDEYENEVLTPRSQDVTTRTFDESVSETEAPDEESYNYEIFRKEYDEQMSKDISSNKTVNYTDHTESEESPKKVLNELLEYKSKNCSKESERLGIKMIECLVSDYQHLKNKAAVRKSLSKVWLVLKVWALIYACIAILCWCQRGWCCCCFRCSLCFPRRRISVAKKYYASNPPGTLIDQVAKDPKKFMKYDPSEPERDAYRVLEAAIRNL